MAFSRGRCLLNPLLHAKGWKQADLARSTGYHPRMISHYVNGKKPMSVDAMRNISYVLNCHMEDLYEWVWVGSAE